MQEDIDNKIKEVYTTYYSVSLNQDKNGMYYIAYNKGFIAPDKYSEDINDYNIASYLFDIKLKELEGH